jgi:hypothetical protein
MGFAAPVAACAASPITDPPTGRFGLLQAGHAPASDFGVTATMAAATNNETRADLFMKNLLA